jgi:hypothetical protein
VGGNLGNLDTLFNYLIFFNNLLLTIFFFLFSASWKIDNDTHKKTILRYMVTVMEVLKIKIGQQIHNQHGS